MKNSSWFIMLYGSKGDPVPMVCEGENGEESVALFETEEGAEDAAKVSLIGASQGYRVYEW